jgi:hypothetical protein
MSWQNALLAVGALCGILGGVGGGGYSVRTSNHATLVAMEASKALEKSTRNEKQLERIEQQIEKIAEAVGAEKITPPPPPPPPPDDKEPETP